MPSALKPIGGAEHLTGKLPPCPSRKGINPFEFSRFPGAFAASPPIRPWFMPRDRSVPEHGASGRSRRQRVHRIFRWFPANG